MPVHARTSFRTYRRVHTTFMCVWLLLFFYSVLVAICSEAHFYLSKYEREMRNERANAIIKKMRTRIVSAEKNDLQPDMAVHVVFILVSFFRCCVLFFNSVSFLVPQFSSHSYLIPHT